MADRYVKLPSSLSVPPLAYAGMQLNGLSAIQSCIFTKEHKGSMFLEEHLLLFMKRGTYHIQHGKLNYTVRENEMILLNKSILIDYHKKGNEDNIFESLMFFLKDEFIVDFMKMSNTQVKRCNEKMIPVVKPVKERLLRFFDSLFPYFTETEKIDDELIKLKMLQLLYDISGTDKNLLQQILQLKKQAYSDLARVMEDNFMNPLVLADFAYLSGRSLASFKRDFFAIYNTSPALWIKEKRLTKAKELLLNTSMSVTDVCYSTGFENTAHFAKIFKEFFGFSPSQITKQTTDSAKALSA